MATVLGKRRVSGSSFSSCATRGLAALQRVDLAASARPADVALLVRELRGPDRRVGASVAEWATYDALWLGR